MFIVFNHPVFPGEPGAHGPSSWPRLWPTLHLSDRLPRGPAGSGQPANGGGHHFLNRELMGFSEI